jgi:hypothetical protein
VFAVLFDFALLIIPTLAIWRPQERLFPIAFTVVFLPYYYAFNTYGLSHTHCLVGFLLVPIAFWATHPRGQYLLWEGLRYFACWVFAAAFVWKLMRGYFWAEHYGVTLIKQMRAGYLHVHPDTILGQSLFWLVNKPEFCDTLMIGGGLLQGVFWVGFFTKRFDKWLVALAVLFHLSTYFLFDIVFFELLVLCLAFWAVRQETVKTAVIW